MKWSLLELNKYKEDVVDFEEILDIKNTLMSRDSSILDCLPVKIVGQLFVNETEYLLHYQLSTVITVPSSRSLVPVPLPLELTVDEVFMTNYQYQNKGEHFADEDIILLDGLSIDLNESVEDNLLLAIPMQVLTKEEQESKELPKGKYWEVMTEQDYLTKSQQESQKKIDPRLAKLTKLFEEHEQQDN